MSGKNEDRLFGGSSSINELQRKRVLKRSNRVITYNNILGTCNELQYILNSNGNLSDDVRYHLLGAIGELQTMNSLLQLHQDYVILNNLSMEFDRGIRVKRIRGSGYDYFYSQQIDHAVVGPTGIFVIESKNWGLKTASESFQSKNNTPLIQAHRCKESLRRYVRRTLNMKIPPVRSIVALSGMRSVKFSGAKGIKVVAINELPIIIQSYRSSISREMAESIIFCLKETLSETWGIF